MILIDTCAAINCHSVSTAWIANLKRHCPTRRFLFETTCNNELNGLSLSSKSIQKIATKIQPIIEHFDAYTHLSAVDLPNFLQAIHDLQQYDRAMLLENLGSTPIKLENLSNGKNRLSDTDIHLIALAMVIHAVVATDDNRMLTVLESYNPKIPFCCSPKLVSIFQKIPFAQAVKLCHDKGIKVYRKRIPASTNICP